MTATDRPGPARRWPRLAAAVTLTAGLLIATPAQAQVTESAPAEPSAQETETTTIDGDSKGRRFDGIGALSAGASSRLLYDYPKKQRDEILDYLFKPGYGAALQMLKVEIGSDVNSTSGSELTHMRTDGSVNCGRGYEWWLMKEAKKRNPNIKLAALAWGAPGWARSEDGSPDGGFYSKRTIDFYMSWMKCAEKHNLRIDNLGGWNERGYDTDWYVELSKRLEKEFPHVKVVAADDCCSANLWRVADSMAQDAAFKKAVDIVGVHFACGHRSEYRECSSTDTARGLGKPLWMSENAAGSRDIGAAPIARALNRMYIDAEMSSYTSWSLISAWYGNLPIADSGLMVAEWPWSGFYDVGKSIWANAHTTQFTEPGWNYLDDGSRRLDSGATQVSLASPDGKDYSTIIEALDVDQPATIQVDVKNLPERELQLWSSDLEDGAPKDQFKHVGSIQPQNGSFSVDVEPGHVYTISTRTDAGKGDAQPAADVHQKQKLPFNENFESAGKGEELAPFFSDVNGAFEIAPCSGDRSGSCYRQQTPQQPVTWNDSGFVAPTTIVGDPRWWGDYTVSSKVLLDNAKHAEVIGRVSSQVFGTDNVVGGYHFRVGTDGWRLYSVDSGTRQLVTLASGDKSIAKGSWHDVALKMRNDRITALLDGEPLANVRDTSQRRGNVGLRTSDWEHAEFDNVRVTPTAASPRTVPKSQLSVSASSDHGFNAGDSLRVENAIDGRPESIWHSNLDQGTEPPHTLTIDTGKRRRIGGLLVSPRIDGETGGMIGDYRVQVSQDGNDFRSVASGTWDRTASTKAVVFDKRHDARYVRLVAPAGACETAASVSEVDVVTRPGPNLTTTPPDGFTPEDPAFENVVPQSDMSAEASSVHSQGHEPCRAIDGDPASFWHSAPGSTEPLPATLTMDLGKAYDVNGLSYLPRQDGNPNGTITDYDVYVSIDGEDFQKLTDSRSWPNTPARKKVTWDATTARYVRLEATGGVVGVASAAEIQIAHQP